jgi:hypothetical protein
VSPELLDALILGLCVVSLVLTVSKVVRGGLRALLRPESVMWLWTLYYLSFLVLRVNIRTFRALLPIVPFLLILAAYGVSQVVQLVALKFSAKAAAAVAVVLLLTVVGLELAGSLERVIVFRRSNRLREQESVAVRAGHWLTEQYDPGTRVLYDPFSYVPPHFADVEVTSWGGTLELLAEVEPDVVIVNARVSERFSDSRQAAKYARGPAEFLARHEYYEALREGQTAYGLVRDFGQIQAYERQ